jgi:prolipoprotein diacylglyceryltransferase
MYAQPGIYELFWGAAGGFFAVGGAASLMLAARRAGRRPGMLLPVLPAVAALCTLIGARLHALLLDPPALAAAIFAGRSGEILLAGGQRLTGGLLLATVVLLLVTARRTSPGPLEILDHLVVPAGLSIALGRIGCFLAGCCFGRPSSLGWAWSYPHGSPAFWNHVAQGRIDEASLSSLHVHPLSLYLGGSAALAAMLSLAAKDRRAPGRATLVFAFCMAVTRLGLEPLREVRFLDPVPGQTSLDVLVALTSSAGLAGFAWRRSTGPPGEAPQSL